ncbi:hypothetical protein HOD84_06085, partial [bacterium]|nr:hypothetical protein [bacterium]
QEGSQEQQENQDQEGSQEQQENQDQEGSQEQQENQDQEGSQEQQENQDQEGSSADNIEKEKSDQMIQAEAILNALKGQEEINQKQKILKSKILKYEKDW